MRLFSRTLSFASCLYDITSAADRMYDVYFMVVMEMFMFAVKSFTARNLPTLCETGGRSSELITVCGKALCGVSSFFLFFRCVWETSFDPAD